MLVYPCQHEASPLSHRLSSSLSTHGKVSFPSLSLTSLCRAHSHRDSDSRDSTFGGDLLALKRQPHSSHATPRIFDTSRRVARRSDDRHNNDINNNNKDDNDNYNHNAEDNNADDNDNDNNASTQHVYPSHVAHVFFCFHPRASATRGRENAKKVTPPLPPSSLISHRTVTPPPLSSPRHRPT